MWKTSKLTDKSQILTYLETDRLYAGFAICDLEPGLFEECIWIGAEKANRLQALVLLFCGLNPPIMLLMGDTDGLWGILENVLCPEQVFLSCRTDHLSVAGHFYVWDRTFSMWRMTLEPARFRHVSGDYIRLIPADFNQLKELYTLVGGIVPRPAQMQDGAYYGIVVDGQLVAAAGTRLISPTYGLAAIESVATHPDYRGRGYATVTTSAVVSDLFQRGIRDVILNVWEENTVAIHIYEKLGFERYCLFNDAPAQRIANQHPVA